MTYDYIIVGRGLMGAAAAKHLSSEGYSVAVVGPDEPPDRQQHQGVFASHYDEGRITRILDPNLHWAQLAQRSIARYQSLEAKTGITFYQEVGHLAVGQRQGESARYLAMLETVAGKLELSVDCLDAKQMRERFPFFRFEGDAVGFYQPRQAGYLSPRSHVAAQSKAVEMNGGTVIKDIGCALHSDKSGIRIETTSCTLKGKGIIVATGGFTKVSGLLPIETPLMVHGQTILLAEVKEADRQTLSGMPSLIHRPVDKSARFYLLPPIRYPDGRWYIKIGCPGRPLLSDDLTSLQRWFKNPGEVVTAEHLWQLITNLLPNMTFASVRSESCITTHTPSGYPIIAWVEPRRLVSLVGGNGYSGKSADELGFIAAQLLSRGAWTYDLPASLFQG